MGLRGEGTLCASCASCPAGSVSTKVSGIFLGKRCQLFRSSTPFHEWPALPGWFCRPRVATPCVHLIDAHWSERSRARAAYLPPTFNSGSIIQLFHLAFSSRDTQRGALSVTWPNLLVELHEA